MPELTPSSTFDLVDGDILFQDLNGAGGDAIGAVTAGFHGAKISHNGIYFGTAGRGFVIEAIYPRVTVTSIIRYLGRSHDAQGRAAVFVGRMKPAYQQLIPAAISEAFARLSLPYDRVFTSGEDALYCSELIADSFKYANGGVTVFPENPMSFRESDELQRIR